MRATASARARRRARLRIRVSVMGRVRVRVRARLRFRVSVMGKGLYRKASVDLMWFQEKDCNMEHSQKLKYETLKKAVQKSHTTHSRRSLKGDGNG